MSFVPNRKIKPNLLRKLILVHPKLHSKAALIEKPVVLLLLKGPVEGHTTEILRLEDREKEKRMIGGEEL